jgi:hypothetical protein
MTTLGLVTQAALVLWVLAWLLWLGRLAARKLPGLARSPAENYRRGWLDASVRLANLVLERRAVIQREGVAHAERVARGEAREEDAPTFTFTLDEIQEWTVRLAESAPQVPTPQPRYMRRGPIV